VPSLREYYGREQPISTGTRAATPPTNPGTPRS